MLIHVAIVSDQLLPTVIPCLMHRPDRVVLVASPPMAGKAERLRRVLEQAGIQAGIRNQAPDAGLDRIRQYATRLADELAAGPLGGELVLNATGGNKLMTLGFVEVFRERADRIIYTDTAHGQIEVIHDRRTAAPQPEPMRDVLDVPRYLAVQGFQYRRGASDDPAHVARMEQRRGLTRALARHASRGGGGFIRALNALGHGAMDERGRALSRPEQTLAFDPRGADRALLSGCAQARLLEWDGARAVRVPDLDAARYVSGGWLEEYAWTVARDAGLFDVRTGVEGVWEGATTAKNEFDLLACHGNRMLFIECKTLRLKQGKIDNEIAYKVDSLGESTRGLLGETWLLTAQEPTPVLRDRAKQASFRVMGPQLLGGLLGELQRWKTGRADTAAR